MLVSLLSLPIEIRYQIFSYLLVSPSNYVTTLPPGPWVFSVWPWDLRQEMTLESYTRSQSLDLSLLRVSKAFNKECKDLLWGRNTFVYKPFEIYRHSESVSEKRLGPLGPLANARRVAMHVDTTIGGRHIEAIAVALEALAKWSKLGSLEEVTLIVVNERRKPFRERDPDVEKQMAYKASLEKVIRSRTGNPLTSSRGLQAVELSEQAKACFQDYLSVFRDARNGCLADVKRSIVVNTNFGSLPTQGQHKYLKEALMHPNQLMMELDVAFGGQLWIDGRLCISDGEQIREAFKSPLDEHRCDEPLESERADSASLATHEDTAVSRKRTISAGRTLDVRSRTAWRQLLEVRASVLDLVE